MRYAVAHGHRARRRRGGAAALGARAVELLRADGHDVTEVVAPSAEQARTACAALVAEGVDALVVAGGDGAVSMATDVCAGSGTAVGVLPAGTGNDNARSLGIPLESGAALRALREHQVGVVDTLLVPELGRHVLGSVCCALDARIAARADGWPRALGAASYSLSALVEIALLRRQPPLHYRITVDGRSEELEALVVVAANMAFFGGGLPIAPAADPTDRLLDLVLITPVSPTQALGLLRAVRAGRHTSHPAVRVARAEQVRVVGPVDIVAQGDGEPLAPLPLTMRVDPASLRVVLPR